MNVKSFAKNIRRKPANGALLTYHDKRTEARRIYLSELKEGENALLRHMPAALAELGIAAGSEIVLLYRRPTLVVIWSEGAQFALSGDLARAVIAERVRT